MPVEHDPFSHIVNVQWEEAAGVFIAGDLDGNIYYLEDEDDIESLTWQNLGKLDFWQEDEEGFRTGRVAGSAYAMIDDKDPIGNVVGKKPVFVLVGGQGFTNEKGVIMASADGLSWSRVFTFGETDSDSYLGAGIFGVVWDKDAQAFYAGGHQVDNGVDAEAGFAWEEQADVLFQSSDGYAWSEAGRHTIRVEAPLGQPQDYPDYNTGLLARHCSTRVKDENGNGIPDGNYGYDEAEKLLVSPKDVIEIDYLFGLYINDIPRNSSTVAVTSFDEEAPSYPLDVGIPITCTATAGGRWLAAGGTLANFDEGKGRSQAAILVPSEDGYVWRTLNPKGTNIIITMTGGITDTNAGL